MVYKLQILINCFLVLSLNLLICMAKLFLCLSALQVALEAYIPMTNRSFL